MMIFSSLLFSSLAAASGPVSTAKEKKIVHHVACSFTYSTFPISIFLLPIPSFSKPFLSNKSYRDGSEYRVWGLSMDKSINPNNGDARLCAYSWLSRTMKTQEWNCLISNWLMCHIERIQLLNPQWAKIRQFENESKLFHLYDPPKGGAQKSSVGSWAIG